MPQNYEETLKNALRNIKLADHMIYITYPVIKDKRLLLTVFDQIYDSIIGIMSSILQHDCDKKILEISSNSKENLEIFSVKCAPRYNIQEFEMQEIKEIIGLAEIRKNSQIEFERREKIVIMMKDLKPVAIDPEKLKKYLTLSKNLLNKAKFGMGFNNTPK